ncbi:MAG: beta strand repeat-containing protein [Limisphaerales bacterium]
MKKNRCWNQTSLACRAKTTVAMLLMLLTATSTSVANNYIFTAGSSASAWLTSGNWSPSGPPGPHDAAQFDTTVPTSSKGAQINFSNPVNNSTDNEAVGAIQVLATRTSASLFIGNGSGSVNGVLTFNGATINGTNNVVLENDSINGSDVTITNVGNGGGAGVTMGVVLGNATGNIIVLNGNGTIGISDIISSSNGLQTPLTFAGSGSGRVNITGTANTWTGNINVTGGEVRFTAATSLGNAANTITVDGGRFGIANGGTVDLSARSIYLGATAGTSISAPGAGAVLTYNGILQDKPGSTGILVKQGVGTLALGGGSTFSGSVAINNGTVQLTTGNNRLPGGAMINIGQSASGNVGTLDLNGFNQTIAGLNSVSGDGTETAQNIITNSSASAVTLTLSGSGAYSYGAGTIANSGIIAGAINLVVNGSGTNALGDINTYTGTTKVNAGTLALTGVGVIGGTPEITVGAGANLDVSARTDDTLTLSSGQQLDGFGMVTGIVATTSGSLLAPGNANTTGTLTVLGNVMLNGAIVMKLNPSGATNDALTVAGRLTYGGTLNVTIPSGTLVAGDSYQLFNAQSYAGSFSVTNLPTLTAGLTWTNTLGIDGTLSVVSISAAISSMAITNVSLSGTNLVFGGTNQGAGTYYVLASTNLTLPVTNWTAIATNVLSGDGNFTLIITNVVDASIPQEFYTFGSTHNN